MIISPSLISWLSLWVHPILYCLATIFLTWNGGARMYLQALSSSWVSFSCTLVLKHWVSIILWYWNVESLLLLYSGIAIPNYFCTWVLECQVTLLPGYWNIELFLYSSIGTIIYSCTLVLECWFVPSIVYFVDPNFWRSTLFLAFVVVGVIMPFFTFRLLGSFQNGLFEISLLGHSSIISSWVVLI